MLSLAEMQGAARKNNLYQMDAAVIPPNIRKIHKTLGDDSNRLISLAEQDGVEDVLVNPDGRIWVNRRGQGFINEGYIHPALLGGILTNIASLRGLPFSANSPVLETDYPVPGCLAYGSRVTGLMAPVVRTLSIAIRPHPRGVYSRQEYEASGSLSDQNDSLNEKSTLESFADRAHGKTHSDVIALAIQDHLNIIVAGSTGSGKTTLLNSLINDIGQLTPNDRIVSIEDTWELQFETVQNVVSLLATADFPMDRCLKSTLRLSPTRIIVGEVRDRAAEYLINAWNTGHSGGLGTVHANGAMEALFRIEEMISSDPSISLSSKIARAVNLIVFIDRESRMACGRKIRQVAFVDGYDRDKKEYRLIPL